MQKEIFVFLKTRKWIIPFGISLYEFLYLQFMAEFRSHLFEKRREEFPKIKMFNLKKKPSKLLNFKYNK